MTHTQAPVLSYLRMKAEMLPVILASSSLTHPEVLEMLSGRPPPLVQRLLTRCGKTIQRGYGAVGILKETLVTLPRHFSPKLVTNKQRETVINQGFCVD